MSERISNEGFALVKDWENAKNSVQQAKFELNRAECAEANARNAFTKWLLPADAKIGEKIAVWVGVKLYQAEVTQQDPILIIRPRVSR